MKPSIFTMGKMMVRVRKLGIADDDKNTLRDLREFFINVERNTQEEIDGVARTLIEFTAFLHRRYDEGRK